MSGQALSPPGASGVRLLPGEPPPPAWPHPAPLGDAVCLDPGCLEVLATRALAAGEAGQACVGVAALHHGEGTSTVARGLAECLAARFGKRVVVVEANQRSPSLRRILGLSDAPGLADVVARRVSLGGALQVTGLHRLVLALPASIAPQPGVNGAALRGVLTALLAHADAVVVDLAPIAPYRDTAGLCGGLDGVVMVMRAGRCAQGEARAAIGDLRSGGARVLGAVFNRERPKRWSFRRHAPRERLCTGRTGGNVPFPPDPPSFI